MYQLKGQLSNVEYYKFEFWKDRWIYSIAVFVPTLLAIFPIDSLSVQQFFPEMNGGEVFLIQWGLYFLYAVIIITVFLFVTAAIMKRSSMEMREYLFSSDYITIRSETGELYVQWFEVARVIEKKTAIIIHLTNRTFLIIPNRFFTHESKKEIIEYVKDRMRGGQHGI